MNNIILATIAHSTYLLSCEYCWQSEPETAQKMIAYRRTNSNFAMVYAVLLFLPPIPTSSNMPLIQWILLTEIFFAMCHRLLHTPYLYFIHKQHHENNPTHCTSCLDAHPIEFFVANIGAAGVPMVILPGTFLTQILWVLIAVVNTVMAHHFEGAHSIHHTKFKYNYSQGTYILDRIFKTYKIK